GCVLTFSESHPRATHHLVWGAAGWHAFLDGLEGASEGQPNRWAMEREMALRPQYQAQFNAIVAPDGEIRLSGGGYEMVFVRRLARPVEKVWAALTVPERIADWLALATIDPDLRLGARFNLDFGDGKHRTPGEIVALEPGRVLAWTWPASDEEKGATPGVVRFELAPDGAGCVLTLTSRGPGRPHPGEAAGWHTHLEGLEDAADGVRTAWSVDREKVHLERYERAVAQLVAQ
ncbi:MAG TPA: SRPBCC domain-containing protein, partial [Caulobacteraceae bacterium]|nr:SRPBCC domain-containing protein [Caulobacteraceae bacterium]